MTEREQQAIEEAAREAAERLGRKVPGYPALAVMLLLSGSISGVGTYQLTGGEKGHYDLKIAAVQAESEATNRMLTSRVNSLCEDVKELKHEIRRVEDENRKEINGINRILYSRISREKTSQ